MDRFGGFKKITVSTATSTLYSKTSGTPTDGASHLQDGQYRVIEYYSASDVGDNTTVTIDPNSAPVHYVVKNNLAGSRNLKFSIVRYGNVVGSRGSVVPLFSELIKKKAKFLPITDKKMTRFWITLNDATTFVLNCFNLMIGGEIFIPKMPLGLFSAIL